MERKNMKKIICLLLVFSFFISIGLLYDHLGNLAVSAVKIIPSSANIRLPAPSVIHFRQNAKLIAILSPLQKLPLPEEEKSDTEIFTPATEPVNIPILMYHHITLDDEGAGDYTITRDNFFLHMEHLALNGYTSISFDELIDFAVNGKPLPRKPIIITFDDGYYSNYAYAYPILKQFRIKATIFAIGSSFGKNTYKDTEYEIIPHFGVEEALEMIESGLISIGSHTFDMHQNPEYESENARVNLAPLPTESAEEYELTLKNDLYMSRAYLETLLPGHNVNVIAFPGGCYNDTVLRISEDVGFDASLSTTHGISTVIPGDPSTLLAMKRFNMNDITTTEWLDELLNAASADEMTDENANEDIFSDEELPDTSDTTSDNTNEPQE